MNTVLYFYRVSSRARQFYTLTGSGRLRSNLCRVAAFLNLPLHPRHQKHGLSFLFCPPASVKFTGLPLPQRKSSGGDPRVTEGTWAIYLVSPSVQKIFSASRLDIPGARQMPQIIEQFQKCHKDHPIAKFFGECTVLKIKLDRCFRQEKALKRKANFEESKKFRGRLHAYRKETTERGPE